MPIRTILVDDEEMALVNLKYALSEYHDIRIIGQFTDPYEAIEQIGALRPDAVLLDIDMPGMNGLETAMEIKKGFPMVNIVFITAYNQYALSAFEVNAIDYVLKPVSSKRLRNAIIRLQDLHALKKIQTDQADPPPVNNTNINNIRETGQDTETDKSGEWKLDKIPAIKNDRIYLLDLAEILYITVDSGKVKIFTENDEFTSRNTIKELEKQHKNRGFFRFHKSFLINLNKIDALIPTFKGLYDIKLKNCSAEIPLSRHYLDEFNRLLL